MRSRARLPCFRLFLIVTSAKRIFIGNGRHKRLDLNFSYTFGGEEIWPDCRYAGAQFYAKERRSTIERRVIMSGKAHIHNQSAPICYVSVNLGLLHCRELAGGKRTATHRLNTVTGRSRDDPTARRIKIVAELQWFRTRFNDTSSPTLSNDAGSANGPVNPMQP